MTIRLLRLPPFPSKIKRMRWISNKSQSIPPITPVVDELQVSFHKGSSTVGITNRNNSVAPSKPFNTTTSDQSPYEEVAANVSNKDDPTMPCLTFRSWLLSLLFSCLFSFVNQFFWFRDFPIIIGSIVALLLSYFFGKIMAKVLPRRIFKICRWEFTFNPGPFTVKEHCIIATMASAASVSCHEYLEWEKKQTFLNWIGHSLCNRCCHYPTFVLQKTTQLWFGYSLCRYITNFRLWNGRYHEKISRLASCYDLAG